MKPAAMKNGKLYSQQPHSGAGDFNFSRADGVQTRINKHGLIETVANNEPRLSYDIVDGKVSDCPHLLLEPSRMNQLQRSEEFDNSTWNKGSLTVTDNQTISPDGSKTADEITLNSTTGAIRIWQTQTTSAATYSLSFFIKYNGEQYVQLLFGGALNSSAYSNFDLINGSVTSGTGKIEDYGNGWYRVSLTSSLNAGTDQVYLWSIDSATASRGSTSSGNGNDGYYVWGSQFEQGSHPTSYIPTSGSTETRQADICNGSGNSETFNSSEGVLFVEFSGTSSDSTSKRITLNDGSTQNRVSVGIHSVSSQLFYFVSGGGSVPFTQAITVSSTEQFNKVAFKYKSGDTALWVNGTEVNTKTNTFNISGLDELSLNDGGNDNPFYGKVKELTVINEALTDEQLQLLTTP